MPEKLSATPHRRLNPLTGEWVLVSPQRSQRPWLGETEPVQKTIPVPYDPECYLCPGNLRARGKRNPVYTSTFVFDNDFPALLPDAATASLDENGLRVAESGQGICRVICFTPRHDLSIPSMSPEDLLNVVNVWCAESATLRAMPFVNYVQIFENRGPMMGASNPHPHCQIWATDHVPNELVKEDRCQHEYRAARGACLLCEYLRLENGGERVISQNDSFVALVPFWAVWPFETLVLPKRHQDRLENMTDSERRDLAATLGDLTRRYDRVFGAPFPYSMGFHERPVKGEAPAADWHFHAHFYPPLLRSATVRKFMVGFELLAEPQRDITPEAAAQRLREV
ncbi:MAG TPA: UDP-glucose--hexose-1-phosphate uridylyltransferase [Bryobacteraceae bacterium]|jgi:UDPglucose--hexose-1-phosphate uridylyltransferase|nr:UDP-glucose--hexose-1-phosphate uridylyltransferase [Bryobacteraceae bacterium]